MNTTVTSPHQRPRPASRVAAGLGIAGGILGMLAGIVELTIGSSIRSWIGDKQDPTRLGLVTIVLSGVALGCARALARRTRPDGARGAWLAAGLLLPGLICFTTVGKLWYVPGTLLVTAGLLTFAGRDLDGRDLARRAGRHWPALLVGTLGAITAALGAAAHGLAAGLGLVGGLAVIAVAVAMDRLPRAATIACLAVAVVPFAIATWWSVVTPLVALLVVVIGTLARRGARG